MGDINSLFFVKAYVAPFSWKQWLLGGIAIAGALTYYCCIIYLCATYLVGGICLLIMKRWRDIVALCVSMAVAAGISIAVFPAMLKHMFPGYRGTESLNREHGLNIWNGLKVSMDI